MKRIVSDIIFIVAILTCAFNAIGSAKAYYYDFTITVSPKSPTIHDDVDVTVTFATSSISYGINFSGLLRIDNEFFIAIDIFAPLIVLPVIGEASETYHLGKLPADLYFFKVNVLVWDNETGGLLELKSYTKSFTVVSRPVGGYSLPIRGQIKGKPLTLYLALAVILTASFTMIKRKTHRKTKQP